MTLAPPQLHSRLNPRRAEAPPAQAPARSNRDHNLPRPLPRNLSHNHRAHRNPPQQSVQQRLPVADRLSRTLARRPPPLRLFLFHRSALHRPSHRRALQNQRRRSINLRNSPHPPQQLIRPCRKPNRTDARLPRPHRLRLLPLPVRLLVPSRLQPRPRSRLRPRNRHNRPRYHSISIHQIQRQQ